MIGEAKDLKKIYRLLMVNLITIARVPMIIIFSCELINYLEAYKPADAFNSMIISIFIIFSDFIDGKLARKYNVTTKTGQVLDIYLDLLYVLTAIGILEVYSKIDFYFIMVIIYKFIEFIIVSKVFKGNFSSKKGENYYYDLLGTLASGLYYIIPLIVIGLMYFNITYRNIIIEIIVVCTTIITGIASAIKVKKIIILQRQSILDDKIAN